MKYTQKNLEKALRNINPEVFDVYKNLAKMELPGIINRMFIEGFRKCLYNGDITIGNEEQTIILRAYNDLHGSLGYFMFEED